MIYITGDTNGTRDISKLRDEIFLNKIDQPGNFLIIVGDVIYNKENIDIYKDMKCCVLFIDGNNDNETLLNSYKVEKFCGGNVHVLSKNLIHLMRGEVYTIENKTFFTFGGADSYNAPYRCRYTDRVEGISFWKSETPSKAEFENAKKNLEKVGYKVDVVLTHDTTTKNVREVFSWADIPDNKTCQMINYLHDRISYRRWYFGHHHKDVLIDGKDRCIYNTYENIEDYIKTEKINHDKEENYSF